MGKIEAMIKLQGKTLSPGMGKGEAFVYRDVLTRHDEFYDIDEAQIDKELARFAEALIHITGVLDDLAEHVEEELDSNLAEVFRAHSMIVQDASLQAEVEKEIREEWVSAGSAVRTVFRHWERRFQSMEAEVARQKGDDIRDLARRLVSSLAGVRGHALEDIPPGCVLVANRLLPSDTIFMARSNVAAAVLEAGGAGSHAALFAHEIGLPCIAGLEGMLDNIMPGELVLVDADTAEAIVNPKQENETAFNEKQGQRNQSRANALENSRKPAVTKDGKPIKVYANVGCVTDTQVAMDNGAEGVGLYRIERAYLGRQLPPGVKALLKEMQVTLEPARGLPVYVRLLDVGADKPLPFLEQFAEINPSLGLRGIRFLEKYPELLQTQLDALLQLSADFDLHILVPMVTLPWDMKWVKELLNQIAMNKGISEVPRLGAMIETPAAALSARDIMKHADFLSFGTNDLTQYVFAADRENAAVDAYFDDTNDIIFRLQKMVHDDVPDVPLSVCGALACRSDCTARLLECGITTLSVAPPSIPEIKQAIRESGGAFEQVKQQGAAK
ncbi:MAG: phosphoenolpyruvate--protein phosphotransferase [Kiritimatiellae bacterium]|jgi:phosphoenolpyruvate-protein phosphotransferase|nr:phosphoenolpyruvate--protein phosphotransferase [Kiritimatiellia bacterium]